MTTLDSFAVVQLFYTALGTYFNSLDRFKDAGIIANQCWLQECVQQKLPTILEQVGPGITPELLTLFLNNDKDFFSQKDNPFCKFINGDNIFNRLSVQEIVSFWSVPAKPATENKPAEPSQPSILEECMRKGMRAFALLPHLEKLNMSSTNSADLMTNMFKIAGEDNGLENLTLMIEKLLESICIDGSETKTPNSTPVKTTTDPEIQETFETITAVPHEILQSQKEEESVQAFQDTIPCDLNMKSLCKLFKDEKKNMDFAEFQQILQTPEAQNIIQCVTQSPDLQQVVQGKGGDLQKVLANLFGTFSKLQMG